MLNFCIFLVPQKVFKILFRRSIVEEGTDVTRVRWMILEKPKVSKKLTLSKRDKFSFSTYSKHSEALQYDWESYFSFSRFLSEV